MKIIGKIDLDKLKTPKQRSVFGNIRTSESSPTFEHIVCTLKKISFNEVFDEFFASLVKNGQLKMRRKKHQLTRSGLRRVAAHNGSKWVKGSLLLFRTFIVNNIVNMECCSVSEHNTNLGIVYRLSRSNKLPDASPRYNYFYTAHFFTRYAERMKISHMTVDDIITKFVVTNILLLGTVASNGENSVVVPFSEGTGIGVKIADYTLMKTFISADIEKPEQASFAQKLMDSLPENKAASQRQPLVGTVEITDAEKISRLITDKIRKA